MNRRGRLLLPALGTLWTLVVPVAAPSQVRDEGVLSLRAGGVEIGQEEFTVTATAGGLRVTSKASFTTVRPALRFEVSVDRSSPTDFAFQFRRSAAPSAQFFAVLGRGRLTLRRIESGTEAAAESRGAPDLVPLVDSMIAPLLQIAATHGDTGGTVTAVFPQGGRRAEVVVERTTEPDGSIRLRLSGGVEATLALGPDGSLLRASAPGWGLEAERLRP